MVTRKSPAKATKATSGASKPAPRARKAAGEKPAKSTAPATRRRAAAAPPAAQPPAVTTAEERYRAIARAAYLRAEKRGFAPGHEVDDWLAAECEYEAAMKAARD